MNFYFKLAFKNLIHHKKHSLLFMVGIIISVSIITSLTLWADSSEDFVVNGFIDDIDYELQIRGWTPETIHNIKSWMINRSEVLAADEVYYNSVMFNAEDKNPLYAFLPFDEQADVDDPVSFGTLLLPTKAVLPRITSQFNVTGDFSLEKNEVLVSEYQARYLAIVYNTTIQPGMVVNLSVSRNSPERSIMRYIFGYQPKHFYNVTIKGIYRKLTAHTTLQNSFSDDFLYQSTIFLQENMDESDINIMEENGLNPLILGKLQIDYLAANGLYGIQDQIENFINLLWVEYPFTIVDNLEELNFDLAKNYTRAKLHFVILFPVVFFSLISSILFLNQMISNRKPDIAILKDRNASNGQILGLFLIEFVILVLFSSLIALLFSYVFAAIIPTISSASLSFESFKFYFLSLKFPIFPYIISLFSVLLIVVLFVILRSKQAFRKQSERFTTILSKRQRLILLYIGFGSSLLILFGFIYLSIRLNNEISSVYSFTIDHIQKSTVSLSLLLILSFCLISFLSIGMIFLLSKSRKVFTKIFPRFNFFLSHNFRQNRIYLSIILFIILTFSFSVISSLTLANTLNQNEHSNSFYNNGSDFRIQTLPMDYNYYTNFTSHVGISNTLPIFQHYGRISKSQLTIYGVNPAVYGQIGRWDKSSFTPRYIPKDYRELTPSELIEQLDKQPNGIIISEGLAKKYDFEFNDTVTIERIRTDFGQIDMQFIVVGIIHSAPGLGLASRATPFLNQMSDNFIIINEQRFIVDFQIQTVNLFFAKKNPEHSFNNITNDLYSFDNVLEVNPKFSLEGLAYTYTVKYLPKIQFFLNVETVLVFIIGIILGFSFINFTYLNRNQVATILSLIGNAYSNYIKLILIELSLLLLIGTVLGFSFSIFVQFLVFSLIGPFLNEPVIIPISFVIDPISTLIAFGIILITFYLSLIPHFVNISKETTVRFIQE